MRVVDFSATHYMIPGYCDPQQPVKKLGSIHSHVCVLAFGNSMPSKLSCLKWNRPAYITDVDSVHHIPIMAVILDTQEEYLALHRLLEQNWGRDPDLPGKRCSQARVQHDPKYKITLGGGRRALHPVFSSYCSQLTYHGRLVRTLILSL